MMWGFISVHGCRVANDNILNNFRLPSAIQNYQLPFIQPWPMSGKVLQFIRLLLIIHRHLVDDSDDGLGVLHAGNSWQLESRGGGRGEGNSMKIWSWVMGWGKERGVAGRGAGGLDHVFEGLHRGWLDCHQWEGVPLSNGPGKGRFLPVLCSAGREQLGLLVSWECWSCGRAWDIQSPWPHTKSLS